MKNLPVVLFFLLIVSCSDRHKVPKDILPKEKMQQVLWSMISAGEYIDGYVIKSDSVNKKANSSKVFAQLFGVYHITKEQFDKSYQYYREHPWLMKVILDSLSKRQLYTTEHFEAQVDSAKPKIIVRDSMQ